MVKLRFELGLSDAKLMLLRIREIPHPKQGSTSQPGRLPMGPAFLKHIKAVLWG